MLVKNVHLWEGYKKREENLYYPRCDYIRAAERLAELLEVELFSGTSITRELVESRYEHVSREFGLCLGSQFLFVRGILVSHWKYSNEIVKCYPLNYM